MHEVRLVYFSESRLVAEDGPLLGQFQRIQRTSAANNRRHSITGALAFDDIWFLQTLEGEREVVWSTFKTILDDRRHDEVVLVECVATKRRLFGDWAMRLVTPNVSANPHLAKFRTDGLLRPNLMSGTDIVAALTAMIASDRASQTAAGEHEDAGIVPRATTVAP